MSQVPTPSTGWGRGLGMLLEGSAKRVNQVESCIRSHTGYGIAGILSESWWEIREKENSIERRYAPIRGEKRSITEGMCQKPRVVGSRGVI